MLIKKLKINLSNENFDDFINECKKNFPNREILVISAMGQVENKNINEDYKNKNSVDYKITDLKKFLNFLRLMNKTLRYYMK